MRRTARYNKDDLTDVLYVRQSLEGIQGFLDHKSHLTSLVGILLVRGTQYPEEISDNVPVRSLTSST